MGPTPDLKKTSKSKSYPAFFQTNKLHYFVSFSLPCKQIRALLYETTTKNTDGVLFIKVTD